MQSETTIPLRMSREVENRRGGGDKFARIIGGASLATDAWFTRGVLIRAPAVVRRGINCVMLEWVMMWKITCFIAQKL